MFHHRLVRFALFCGLVAVALGAGYTAGAQSTPKKGEPNDLEVGQVMRVGSHIITAEDLIARIGDAERMLKPEHHLVAPSLAYLRDVALLDLESRRLGLVLSGEEIETCTRQQIENVKAEIKRSSRGMLTYEQWLEQQGLTKESFETYLLERAPIILRKRVLVTYFSEVTQSLEAWHILVRNQSAAQAIYDELRVLAADKRIQRFEELAVQKSEDTSSSINKGRIGRIYRDSATLVPEAETALWNIKDDEVAPPVKSSFGWHVFLRRLTLTPAAKPLAAERDRLMKAEDVKEDLFNTWVRHVGITQKYVIERRLPGFDCKPNQKASK
ncbi:MAG: peptidylprolyl isomerase [Planctomycetes bacterium]|jgi:hypothetical protein|nr:peptidylprolyl isomerase [Planctomycetota bacterium]MCL4731029.1 peptidylprolyl isomerase [Planctomycetota bacterium]